MAKREGTEYVTKRDFYTALLVVWLYIMLMIGNSIGPRAHWRMYLYFAGSVFALVAYAVMTIQASRRRGGKQPDGEARDTTAS